MANTVIRNPRDAALVRLDDLVWKGIVKAATDAALPANTRTGNVLIADANGAFGTVDGVTINTNGTAGLNDGTEAGSDKILVKDEAAGANHGKYFLSDPGSAGQKWRLTRTSDANASSEVTAGFYIFADQGTTNPNSTWVITTDDPITLNTTSLTFGKFSGAGQIVAGTGMTKTGDTLNVIGGDGITANADNIVVDFNTTNLQITANQINTIQDIDTTASPTFTGLLLSGSTMPLEIKSTDESIMQTRWSDAAIGGANTSFQRSRGGTIDDDTVVQNGDRIARLNFSGYDGAGFIRAAEIRAEVDGVPGVGDMPGRFVFLTTAPGSSIPTERIRIDSSGLVTFANDAIVSQHMSIGANASLSANVLLDLNETIVSGDTTTGIFSTIILDSTDNTKAVFGAIISGKMSGTTGGTDIMGANITATSGVTAGTSPNLVALKMSVGSSPSTLAPATAIVLEIQNPLFLGTKPTTYDGIFIANQGVSGITTSTAIKIEDQSGSTNNFAIVTGTGTVSFGDDVAVTGQLTATAGVDISASQAFSVAGTAILSDSAGTMTLSNVDALDATTEATVEAAIDTLANLTTAAALATVGTLTTGNADAIISAASVTVAGKVELATSAETNTGTDATRAVTPDGLDDWTGSVQLTTLGTIATGTWEGTTIAVNQGGTGQTTYINGELLIGNTTGNTLAKATLTAGSTKLSIVNSTGSITLDVVTANIDHDALLNFVSGEHFLQSAITTVGALNAGSITSGFGNIDKGTSGITTTGIINNERSQQ